MSGLVRKATERVQKTKAAKKLQQKEEEAAGARRSSAMGYTGSRAFRQAGPHILTSWCPLAYPDVLVSPVGS